MKSLLNIINSRSTFFWIGFGVLCLLIGLSVVLDFNPQAIANWFSGLSGSPYAVPMIVLAYLGGAFISVPQWMLHGGSVLVFGPLYGSALAWAATMVSACFEFWLARRLGAGRVSKMTGDLVSRFMDMIERHGFWTSLIVRIVPTGPFVVVNMAAGVTGMRFNAFALGTMIGILPKIITIAFFGEGIQSAISGQSAMTVGVIVVLCLVWIGAMVFARKKLQNKIDQNQERGR